GRRRRAATSASCSRSSNSRGVACDADLRRGGFGRASVCNDLSTRMMSSQDGLRVAALYDIHGMLEPLEAVLRDLEREEVDAVLIGGDAVSGPQPAETLELLRSLEAPTYWIRGNGERAL